MAPVEAKIFIIEDNPSYLSTVKKCFEMIGGHHVVGVATTFKEAEVVIPTFADLGV